MYEVTENSLCKTKLVDVIKFLIVFSIQFCSSFNDPLCVL